MAALDRVNILLVDDRPENLLALEAVLASLDQNLVMAAGGEDALRNVLEREFALILMDVEMPGMGGFEAASLIRERENSRLTPIIFVTASHGSELRAFEGYSAGAVDYLFKPLNPEVLKAKVSVFVELARANRALRQAQEELEQRVEERTKSLRESEERIRAEGERFRSAFEDTNVAMVLTDLEHRFIRVNAAFCRLFGYSEPEMLRMTTGELTHPDDRAESYRRREPLLAGESDFFQMEKRYLHKDGSILWGLTNVSLTRDAGGQPLLYIGQVQDITERKQAEEAIRTLNAELEQRVLERTVRLEAANRELDAFSYSVSHDLRAPLRSIDGFSAVLLEDHAAALPAEGKDALARIRAAAQRMSMLIDDLLDLSRVSRSELKREPLDMSALAGAVADGLRQSHREREIDFLIPTGVVADADPRLLRVVLENLLGNACKFTSRAEGARIEVGLASNGDGAAYFVRDNGAGFDMSYANKLFGAFQRLHSAAEFEGTGIGLATVQRIVHRHGGRVWAEAAVGEGATFYFTLGADEGSERTRE